MGFRGEQQELHGMIAALTERVRQLEQIVSDQRAKIIAPTGASATQAGDDFQIGDSTTFGLLYFEVTTLGLGDNETNVKLRYRSTTGPTVATTQVLLGAINSGGPNFRNLMVSAP